MSWSNIIPLYTIDVFKSLKYLKLMKNAIVRNYSSHLERFVKWYIYYYKIHKNRTFSRPLYILNTLPSFLISRYTKLSSFFAINLRSYCQREYFAATVQPFDRMWILKLECYYFPLSRYEKKDWKSSKLFFIMHGFRLSCYLYILTAPRAAWFYGEA